MWEYCGAGDNLSPRENGMHAEIPGSEADNTNNMLRNPSLLAYIRCMMLMPITSKLSWRPTIFHCSTELGALEKLPHVQDAVVGAVILLLKLQEGEQANERYQTSTYQKEETNMLNAPTIYVVSFRSAPMTASLTPSASFSTQYLEASLFHLMASFVFSVKITHPLPVLPGCRLPAVVQRC